MKSKVLIPHEIAEKCTMLEALYYMAFNIPPLYLTAWGDIDIRQDLGADTKGEYDIFSEGEKDFIIDNEMCVKFGLPNNPYYEELKNDFLYEASLPSWKDPRLTEEQKLLIKEHKVNLNKWHNELWKKLESQKYALLEALSGKKIKSFGKKFGLSLKANNKEDILDDDAWDWNPDYYKQIISLPENFFNNDKEYKIDWDSSRCADLKLGYYIDILLDVGDLTKCFQEVALGTHLNTIIGRTYRELNSSNRKAPTAPEVWREINKNRDNYSETITKMPSLYEICWKVSNTGEMKTMSKKRFQNIVSELRNR
jgi:hypothetical protein